MAFHRAVLLAFSTLLYASITAQDSSGAISAISSKYISEVSKKVGAVDRLLDKKTEKALSELMHQEAVIATKLQKIDPNKAEALFDQQTSRLKAIKARIANGSAANYISTLDSLNTSLRFLSADPQLLEKGKEIKQNLSSALAKSDDLKAKFQQAEELKAYLVERKQYLKQQLDGMGFARELKKINKQAYYYSAQVKEYQGLLKDHKKAGKKALSLLSKSKAFNIFMRKHSQLASLFRMPGDEADPGYAASLTGLQTRAQVSSLIQQQLGSAGSIGTKAIQANLQDAQIQISQLRDKIVKQGGESSDEAGAEGFRPNSQKTKRFLKRLEFGSNVQSQRGNAFLPTSTSVGLSVGYKLNDRSVIGIGASYQLGWGNDIRHIRISHQGVGVRSFVDWKLKHSFWISGGYERNYRAAFRDIVELRDRSAWQESGLLGISKVLSVKSKLLKQTKVQLLWDFLSYQQAPVTQPILFRIGYTF